jgi:hypothetical protein
MQNLAKTRFIAANYSSLQGLKGVPLGLLLISVVLWANQLHGRATDLSLPILFGLVTIIVTFLIYRYYKSHYGKVESTPKQKRVVSLLSAVAVAAALGAFLGDNYLHLPLSLVGLVFAAAAVAEYLRMQWIAPGRYLLPAMLACFTIVLVVSILPLLGAGEWWKLLGLRAQMFGVLVVVGAVIVVYGLFNHWYFVHQLSIVTPAGTGEK